MIIVGYLTIRNREYISDLKRTVLTNIVLIATQAIPGTPFCTVLQMNFLYAVWYVVESLVVMRILIEETPGYLSCALTAFYSSWYATDLCGTTGPRWKVHTYGLANGSSISWPATRFCISFGKNFGRAASLCLSLIHRSFFSGFATYLFNTLVWMLAPPDYFAIGGFWAIVIMPAAVTRLVLNLREEYEASTMPRFSSEVGSDALVTGIFRVDLSSDSEMSQSSTRVAHGDC